MRGPPLFRRTVSPFLNSAIGCLQSFYVPHQGVMHKLFPELCENIRVFVVERRLHRRRRARSATCRAFPLPLPGLVRVARLANHATKTKVTDQHSVKVLLGA